MTAIKKITIENEEYFLFSQFVGEASLSIYLFNLDRSECYVGFASESDLRCMAANVRLAFSDFCADTLCAMSLNNSSNLEFSYILDKNDDSYIFKWKKVVNEGIKVILGNVTVNVTEFNVALSEFLTKTALVIQESTLNLKKFTDELCKIEKEKKDVETTLEDAVKIKENLEKEMYTKFLIILNNKKRKIKELYEEIDLLESKKKKSKPVLANGKTSKKSDTDIKNDDFKNKPGTSKVTKQSLDSSFVLDDIPDQPIFKPSRPRRRKQDSDAKTSVAMDICDKTVIQENIINDDHVDESVDGLLDFL